VEELHVAQDTKNKERDAKLLKLMDLQEADNAKYQKELGVWQGWDRRIHSNLHGLDDALLGQPSSLILHFYSPTLLLFSLVVPAEAFPDSSDVAAVVVEKCQQEYEIVRGKDSTTELPSVELAASVKGQLQPVATLGTQLRITVVSIFKTLWPGWEEPSTISRLAQWMALVPNRVEV
jgi:hypothetical protein